MIRTLHFQLLAAHTMFQRTFLRNIRKIHPDLLPGQPKVLDYLMEKESACQREIADACLLEPSTLCLILEKMEAAGLILRGKLPDNRKNSIVALSVKGRRVGMAVKSVFIETENRLCRGLGREERLAFSNALRTISENAREVQDEEQVQ